jgi:hypothetical protein
MHNGRVGGNGSTHDIVSVGEVDYDDLILVVDLFAHAYEMIRFEG